MHWSGSRPCTCVHAHGHDVDPTIEASCNNNYFVDIRSSGICELILCNRGFDHIFSLIPFLGQVKALIFCNCGSDHMFFFDPISRASLSTCLLWINTPVQPLLWSFVEYYPPSISRLSWNCITSYEFFIKYYILTDYVFFHGLQVIKHSKTDNWTKSALRFNNS